MIKAEGMGMELKNRLTWTDRMALKRLARSVSKQKGRYRKGKWDLIPGGNEIGYMLTWNSSSVCIIDIDGKRIKNFNFFPPNIIKEIADIFGPYNRIIFDIEVKKS